MRKAVVMSFAVLDLDFIEEIRLRTWARENYVPEEDRDETWHPVILDEMLKRDREVVAEEEEVVAA
jgi:hypothetical protein